MKINMGSADRIIRVVIAAVILTLFLLDIVSGTLGFILLAVAAIFLLTAIFGICPVYLPFGIKTCKTKNK